MSDGSKRAAPDSGWFGCEGDHGALALIEVPFDATSSFRRVARHGPAAMRAASQQVDWALEKERCPLRRGLYVHRLDLALLNEHAAQAMQALRSAQDHDEDDAQHRQDIDKACAQVEQQLCDALAASWQAERPAIVVGGDHGSVYAGMHAAVQRWPELGILHIDAHADRRPAYEGITASHASVMHRLRAAYPSLQLTHVGLRDLHAQERKALLDDEHAVAFFDEDLVQQKFLGMPWAEQARAIIETLPQQVWISLDVDGLDPHLCPNTGTPVPGGLSFYEACDLIARVGSSGRRLMGADLCEVGAEAWDANVGSRLLYRLLAALV